MYKLFQRLLLARLQPIVEKSLPLEQAGFRQNRNCCDQIMALTTHVENGFQQKSKLGAVFLDLSSAYDTVWTRGLLLKMAKIVRCKATLPTTYRENYIKSKIQGNSWRENEPIQNLT